MGTRNVTGSKNRKPSTPVTKENAEQLASIAMFELDRLLAALANTPETDDPLDIYKVRGLAVRCQQVQKVVSDVWNNEPCEAMIVEAEETLRG